MSQPTPSILQGFVILSLLLVAGGCTDGPRNGQALQARSDVLTFSGMLEEPGWVNFFALNESGTYDYFGHAYADTVYHDAEHEPWYRYSAELALPQGNAYWRENTSTTQLRGLQSRLAITGTPLISFDIDADACLSANIETVPGGQLALMCKSASSAVVTVSYPSGGVDQPCFRQKASPCAPSLVCDRNSMCRTIDAVTSRIDGTIKGDASCPWGTKDCNRCVNNVATQLAALPVNPKTFEIEGFHYPTNHWFAPRLDDSINGYEHIQGVGRITGSGNNWFVYGVSINSDKSDTRASLMYPKIGQGASTNGYRFGADMLLDNNGNCTGYTLNNCPYNRNWTRNFFEGNGRLMKPTPGTYTTFPAATSPALETRTNHVSGIQTVGQLVANVNWCQEEGSDAWCDVEPHCRTFVISDASNPARAQTISRLDLQPHVNAKGSEGGANASMVKLASGNHLVHAYGHFFVSDRVTIDPNTKWLRVPTNVLFGLPSPGSGREYNNMSLLTECSTGDVYAFPISGSPLSSVPAYHYVTAHKLTWSGINVTYGPKLTSSALLVGSGHWRAGSSLYVDPAGRVVLYATSMDQHSNGNVIITEH